VIGDAVSAADYVRIRRDRVDRSDVDLLCDLDSVIDLVAQVELNYQRRVVP